MKPKIKSIRYKRKNIYAVSFGRGLWYLPNEIKCEFCNKRTSHIIYYENRNDTFLACARKSTDCIEKAKNRTKNIKEKYRLYSIKTFINV